MSTLIERINLLKLKVGPAAAMATLCKAVNVSDRTIRRWIKNGFPTEHDAYTVALACGCGDREAVALARASLQEAKEHRRKGEKPQAKQTA